MLSRTCVTVVPVTTPFSASATSCELRPSCLAWSWSMRMRITRAGSTQSKLTLRTPAVAPSRSATCKAIARTPCGSGPLTRYFTGQPTGGPSSSG